MESLKEEIKEPLKTKINTKDELILNIKEWIKIDNELTKMKIEVKERTNKKKELTESLVNIMKSNSIDCFDINGGALIYKQKKTRKITHYVVLRPVTKQQRPDAVPAYNSYYNSYCKSAHYKSVCNRSKSNT